MAKIRYPWPEIQRFYDANHSGKECRQRFGFSVPSWYKAIKAGRLILREGDARLLLSRGAGNSQYDWAAVQRYYDEGHSSRACREKFGFALCSFTDAVKRGAIVPRAAPKAWPVEKVLAFSTSRATVKRCLLRAGMLSNRCEECGLTDWRGRRISIQIDHRNGVRDDHRIENLRMLCPNCHSQTETFAAKNRTRSSLKTEQSRVV